MPLSRICSRPPRRRAQHCSVNGFTSLELLIVLLIMAITASIGIDSVARFDSHQRAERAARNCIAFTRYARNLALTTGIQTKLSINTTTGTFGVYSKSGATWNLVSQNLINSGTMTITLSSRSDLVGTTLSVSPAGTTDFIYTALGTCSAAGTLTFSCAAVSHTVTIPIVGDPVYN